MPGAVANDSLPHPAAAVVVVTIDEAFITDWAGVLSSGQDVNRLACFRAVEVPDVDFAVVGAGVDVATIGGSGRAEMAADEGFEDAVAAEGNERAVVGVGAVLFCLIGREAVVEVGCVVLSCTH